MSHPASQLVFCQIREPVVWVTIQYNTIVYIHSPDKAFH